MSFVVYNPVLGSMHEIDNATRLVYVASALKAEKQLQDNPNTPTLVIYNPMLKAYQELDKATASLFIQEAKKIA